MISNELRLPFKGLSQTQPRPPVQEDTLNTGQVQIERKTITFILKENPRGRFLRIIEEGSGHNNSIIIPATGLDAVVVSHGSDTLAWTAAALSYALKGIPRPVVLFGADKALEDEASNGPDNFRDAISFALSEALPGLFVSWRNPG